MSDENLKLVFGALNDDCVRIIISYCDLFSLFCLQLTSIALRSVSRKKYRNQMFQFNPTTYQLNISNSAAPYEIGALEWLLTLYKTWIHQTIVMRWI